MGAITTYVIFMFSIASGEKMEKLVDARDARELSGAVPIKQRRAKLGTESAKKVPASPPPHPKAPSGNHP